MWGSGSRGTAGTGLSGRSGGAALGCGELAAAVLMDLGGCCAVVAHHHGVGPRLTGHHPFVEFQVSKDEAVVLCDQLRRKLTVAAL